jgi:hypothetical protein
MISSSDEREEIMRIPALIMAALSFGASPAWAWTEYTYLDQNVAIQFPAKPETTKATYDSAFAKGLPSTIYATEHDHVLYKLTVIDLPASRPEMGANFLNEAAYWLMRKGDVLFTDFPRVYQEARAIYGVTLVVDRSDKSRARTSLYYHKGRLYMADTILLPARGDFDMSVPSRYDQTIRFPPDGRFD